MLVDYEFYTSNGYSKLDETQAAQYLSKSERQINTICLGRLYDGTFEKYTTKTQDIVKIIICEHADYLLDYEGNDETSYGPVKSYSNGKVSFSFDTAKSSITHQAGVGIKTDLYQELTLTGLCYRGIL